MGMGGTDMSPLPTFPFSRGWGLERVNPGARTHVPPPLARSGARGDGRALGQSAATPAQPKPAANRSPRQGPPLPTGGAGCGACWQRAANAGRRGAGRPEARGAGGGQRAAGRAGPGWRRAGPGPCGAAAGGGGAGWARGCCCCCWPGCCCAGERGRGQETSLSLPVAVPADGGRGPALRPPVGPVLRGRGQRRPLPAHPHVETPVRCLSTASAPATRSHGGGGRTDTSSRLCTVSPGGGFSVATALGRTDDALVQIPRPSRSLPERLTVSRVRTWPFSWRLWLSVRLLWEGGVPVAERGPVGPHVFFGVLLSRPRVSLIGKRSSARAGVARFGQTCPTVRSGRGKLAEIPLLPPVCRDGNAEALEILLGAGRGGRSP